MNYWNKNVEIGHQKLEKSPFWKGENVGYSAVHKSLKRNFGNPSECSSCKKKGERIGKLWNIEWANVSGRYLRDKSDYIALCRKCHYKQEQGVKNKKFVWDSKRNNICYANY